MFYFPEQKRDPKLTGFMERYTQQMAESYARIRAAGLEPTSEIRGNKIVVFPLVSVTQQWLTWQAVYDKLLDVRLPQSPDDLEADEPVIVAAKKSSDF